MCNEIIYMNPTTVSRLGIVVSLTVVLILIGALLGIANMRAIAQSYNLITSNYNTTTKVLSLDPPERVTFSPLAHPPVLSDDKRRLLQSAEEVTDRSPSLPISNEPIHAPLIGTETQTNNK